jgi:DNA helicase-2/ATP-dependent DNA helicase PcrA
VASSSANGQAFLEGLTASQRAAVMHGDGPLLVLAGPGSGKTRVITRRVAYMLAQGVPPWNILAVTFTNKAAGEMRERVVHLVGEAAGARGLTVTTFHSLCVRLLRRWCEESGLAAAGWLKPNFTIMDADDQAKLIKAAITALDLNTTNWPPRAVLAAISTAKNDLKDAATYQQEAQDFQTRTVARVYTAYQQQLRTANAVDFDDLLLLTARMLQTSDSVRHQLQSRYRYLMIDEYQDTNKAQFVIASLLAGDQLLRKPGAAAQEPPNFCVVGDPDQSIYGWRGADIANILQFEKIYPGAKVIALGENFRSRESILAVADRLIKRNTERRPKPLVATRGKGRPVEVVLCRDEHHEARLVVDWLKRQQDEAAQDGRELAWKHCAVFYRTNAMSRVLEDAMRRAAVPYNIVRGTSFYQREEVKNAGGYLRLLVNPADSVSLERVINTPSRGISDATVEKVASVATARGVSLYDAMREVAAGQLDVGLTGRAAGAVAKFVTMLDGWRAAAADAPGVPGMPGEAAAGLPTDPAASASGGETPTLLSLSDLVGRVVRESGLEEFYAKEDERKENLAELVNAAGEFQQGLVAGATASSDGEAATSPADGPPELAPDFLSLGEPNAALAAVAQQYAPPGDPDDPFADGGSLYAEAPPAPPNGHTLLDLLAMYLERIALVADSDAIDPARGAVTLMTLHAAKGLEFPVVAMIGLEDGALPHMRALQSEREMEEERRLCFVGITRAMEHLLMTAAKFRTQRGLAERTIPSRFLDEIAGQHVVTSDQSDPFGGGEDDPDMAAFLAGDEDYNQDPERPGRSTTRGGFGSPMRSSPESGATTVGSGGMRRPTAAPGRPGASGTGGGAAASGGGGRGGGGGGRGGGGEFEPGAVVRHPQFGEGTVLAYFPGAAARVKVKFKAVGEKTLVLEYARLTKVRAP